MKIPLKGKTIGILGGKGTGKTFFTRQLVEAIKTECIVIDTIGMIKPANIRRYDIHREKLDRQALMAGLVAEGLKNGSVVINLGALTRKESQHFLDMMLLSGEIKNKFIFADEIAELVPQGLAQSREFERLIRHGRNFGNSFVFNTQRPSYIHKNTLNLVDVLIVFRMTWNRDIEVLRELLSNLGKPDKIIDSYIQRITNLEVGEFIMFTFGGGYHAHNQEVGEISHNV